jgi:hypothetical protein
VPDAFVVGYGIDYAGAHRGLPDIFALGPEALGEERTVRWFAAPTPLDRFLDPLTPVGAEIAQLHYLPGA